MVKTIKKSAKTVDEAIRLALEELQVSKEQATIDVVQHPTSGVFGFNQKPAIVHVKIKEAMQAKEDVSVQRSSARIENEQFVIHASGSEDIIIIPHPKLQVYINDQKIENATSVLLTDNVVIKSTIEKKEPIYQFMIDNDKMKATIHIEPGEETIYKVSDHSPSAKLQLSVHEEKNYFNELTKEMIIAELERQGIAFGIQEENILDAIGVLVEKEVVLAIGTKATEGKDGQVDFYVDYKIGMTPPEIDQLGKVDFRETRMIPQVRADQCVAAVIPPKPGNPGMDVKGNVLQPKPVKEVSIRLGQGLYQQDQSIYASMSGRLHVEVRGTTVRMEVLDRLLHEGDVNISTGNVRFQGDVEITGKIEEKMKVEAEGDIEVKGQVSGASLFASKSTIIEKNVFAAVVKSGKTHLMADVLLKQLESVVTQLTAFETALQSVLKRLEQVSKENSEADIQQAIQLLIDHNFKELPLGIKSFVREASQHQDALPKEWIHLANQLYLTFMTKNSKNISPDRLKNVAKEAEYLLHYYSTPADENVFISIPYAINSQVSCSGDIIIWGQGVYNSTLKSGGDIKITGYIKGGVVEAEQSVQAKEAGSESGVPTLIKVSEKGRIILDIAHIDTVIQIGKKKHTFLKKTSLVEAHLNEEGELKLGPNY
ncbi:FapA family protein [Bacillus sp. REN10]|uniref:FapA family protein n=1 Tax=Bacillus sp. REN10 TaxID=2782541 RepID=UPI00193C5748|nr:FapA family protein [Bacillus sp. REN10]